MKQAFPNRGGRCIFESPKYAQKGPMIRHQVYFDTLGSMREDTASWRSVFAGLSVLRLVDSYAGPGSPADPAGWAQLHSVRTAIEEMSEGDVIRGVLTTVIEELTQRRAVDETVCVSLLAYGRALDYEASWGLATDVFSTVAKHAIPERNPRLAVEANVSVGGAARRSGDWEASARAYSQAAYIADTLGDRPGVLTVQVGIANTYLAKGNLPQAQSILDDVIVQARDQALPEIQGMALHSRAVLTARRGEPSEGLKLAYEALGLTSKPSEKDQVLVDIAGMFTALGMHDSARDAHLILTATAQAKFVRWSAILNLMELAGLDGIEDAFDTYARQLALAPMGVWIRSHYLLFLGEGLHRFGREQAAIEALEEAVSFAEANQIHHIAFKAQDALAGVRSTPRAMPTFTPPPARVPDDLGTVVRAISDLRKATVTAT
jgi:tetratricopeptide (TPR) repeat protein